MTKRVRCEGCNALTQPEYLDEAEHCECCQAQIALFEPPTVEEMRAIFFPPDLPARREEDW